MNSFKKSAFEDVRALIGLVITEALIQSEVSRKSKEKAHKKPERKTPVMTPIVKFRGVPIGGSDYVYGSLISGTPTLIVNPSTITSAHGSYKSDVINKKTVGQLIHKDSNKEVYTGDLLRSKGDGKIYTVVIFNNKPVLEREGAYIDASKQMLIHLEVVGCIHLGFKHPRK